MSENKYVVEYTRPANERAGTHLVLMLHGYGSQEHDLLSLAAHLPQEGFTYASMRAPQPVGSQFSADSTGATLQQTLSATSVPAEPAARIRPACY